MKQLLALVAAAALLAPPALAKDKNEERLENTGVILKEILNIPDNIPKELHEAAEVDGANGWQRFWKISFPLLTPYIFYNLVVGLISMLQIFEPIFVLYRDNQPIVPSAISMVYYLWQASFRHFEIGYGSAISWLILIIILIVTTIQFKMQNRWVTYDLY